MTPTAPSQQSPRPRPSPLARRRPLRALPVVAAAIALLAVQTGCGASAMAAPQSTAASPSAGALREVASEPMPSPAARAAAPATPPPPAPVTAAAAAPGTAARPVDARSAKNAGPSTRAPVIIYQGDLRMAVDEEAFPRTIDTIIDVAEGLGGHLASRKDQSVTVKVPSASFRAAMTKIDALGGVIGRSVTADDVSEEFHDLEVRLANLRTTRARLQEFMSKVAGIQDMLTVERELERVAQEIDRIEGRLEFLRTRASMSVIAVQLSARPKAIPFVAAPPPPRPARAGIDLPIPWVSEIGIDPLLSLRK